MHSLEGTQLADVSIIDQPTHIQLLAQIEILLDPSEPPLTLMANLASLLFWSLPGINWVGFYLSDGERLVLGPFHGKPACTVILLGSGVCGTAARERRTLNVADVETFPGHIACDSASRSEVVIPLVLDGELWGVFDVDSPEAARFDDETQSFLEKTAEIFLSRIGNKSVFPS
ncbi:MAG: GAF domain-containing protein [Bacteroidota bacterium]